jgi:hypothetical protein
MDCIYLSQKFGRPLVRRSMPSCRFVTITYGPFLSPMIRGEEAQSLSVFRVGFKALILVPDDPHFQGGGARIVSDIVTFLSTRRMLILRPGWIVSLSLSDYFRVSYRSLLDVVKICNEPDLQVLHSAVMRLVADVCARPQVHLVSAR